MIKEVNPKRFHELPADDTSIMEPSGPLTVETVDIQQVVDTRKESMSQLVMDEYCTTHYIENVPSGYIPYSNGVTRIPYRCFNFGELKRLNSANFETPEAIELSRKVIGIDIDELTIADYKYILIHIANVSVPTVLWNQRYQCPSCGAMNSRIMNPGDWQFETLEVEKLPLWIKKPNTTDQYHLFDCARVKDIPLMTEAIKQGYDPDTVMYAIQLRDFEGKFEEAYHYVDNLSGENIELAMLLEAADLKVFHSILPVIIECNGKLNKDTGDITPCESKFKAHVDPEVIDLLPFRKLEEFDGGWLYNVEAGPKSHRPSQATV